MTDGWIIVRNWERFQHYRDRAPAAWIKVYTASLVHRDEWSHLSLSERGLLVCIWIEYALSRGQLRASDLSGKVLQKVPRRSLDSLVEAGFIELSASKPSRARADAPSLEKEEEEDFPKKVFTDNGEVWPSDAVRAAAWIDAGAADEIPLSELPKFLRDFGVDDQAQIDALTIRQTERKA